MPALRAGNTKFHGYFYQDPSRLAGEPIEGVNDFHIHPAEPRTVRTSVTYKF